jgi:TRAP-type C4-dicarboxylate transport system substrate-binding protein
MNMNGLLKRFLCVSPLFLFVAFFFSTSSAQPSAPDKSIELKAVSFLPAMNATSRQFRQYAEKVGEASKGALRIKFLGGPEVIPPFEQGQALSRGVVDMAIITPSHRRHGTGGSIHPCIAHHAGGGDQEGCVR